MSDEASSSELANGDLVKQAMITFFDGARGGDAAAAAMTAMLIHLYPEIAQEEGVSAQYEWLLAQCLQSKEPELLACLGEELMKGKRLAANAKMAHRALEKANEVSGFMGAYILGRFLAAQKPELAIKQLRKGRMVGHIPSAMYEHHLVSKRIPLVGVLVKWWFKVFDGIVLWRAVQSRDKARLWRALDFARSDSQLRSFHELLGPDRVNPFVRLESIVANSSTNSALKTTAPPQLPSKRQLEPPIESTRSLHLSLRLLLGLFFSCCALICFVGSSILIVDPQSENPLVAQICGVVMALTCVWVLSIAIRLMFNRPNQGGLLSPLTLRLVAVYMAALPTFMLITGRSSSWTFLQYFQAAMFIFGAFGLWRLASWRKASNLRA
jgi:hypothetical protein